MEYVVDEGKNIVLLTYKTVKRIVRSSDKYSKSLILKSLNSLDNMFEGITIEMW